MILSMVKVEQVFPVRVPSGLLRVLACCLPLAIALGCSGADAAREMAAGRSNVLVRGDFVQALLLTGELQAVRSVRINSPQTNLFQMRIQFMAEEGAFVRKDDPLLDFDNTSFADQVRNLETQILDAETQIVSKRSELASALKDLEIELAEKQYALDFARLEASIDPVVVSRKEFSERELTFAKAGNELEETQERIALTRERGQADLDVLTINRDKLEKDLFTARKSLDLLSIKAPAEGLVVYETRQRSTLRYQEGDSCWPGQAIMRLPDLSEMQLVLSVNEVDVPKLAVGMKLAVALDAFPGRELTGTVLDIPSMAVKRDEDSKIAVFKITAALSETWVGEMKPGMSALAVAAVAPVEDAPLVLRSAVAVDGRSYRLMTEANADASFTPLARNAEFYRVGEEDWARLSRLPLAQRAKSAARGDS